MSIERECPLLDSSQSNTDGAECGLKLVGVDGERRHPVRGVDGSYGSHTQICSSNEGSVEGSEGGLAASLQVA